MDKGKLHQFLSNNPDILKKFLIDSQVGPSKPKDAALGMAWENGRASYAAELLSLYNEVEGKINDRHNT